MILLSKSLKITVEVYSNVINLVTNYLSDRQRRVRLSGQYSSMKTIMKGVFQGSILGSILFNSFMNDLSYAIDEWTLFTYAADTQLFKSAEDIDQVEHAINADLRKVDKWYKFNQMKKKIIQNIKQLHLEGSREILCWPVKEPLSLFKMKWNSLALLLITSLSLRDRFIKSVVNLVNRLLFSIVWRKYCLLNWG